MNACKIRQYLQIIFKWGSDLAKGKVFRKKYYQISEKNKSQKTAFWGES